MKKIILILTGAILSSALLEGCLKKGENDPFISLKSRRARVAGEWKMTKYEITITDSDQSGTDTYVYSGNGSIMNLSVNGVSLPAFTYTMDLSMDKSGAFTQTITDATYGTPQTSIDKGQWYFAGKNKDLELKNKEAVIYDILSSTDASGTDTYTGIYADEIYVIDQLKNKEMIIIVDGTGNYSDGSSSTRKGTMTFTQ